MRITKCFALIAILIFCRGEKTSDDTMGKRTMPTGKDKIQRVMHEFKEGDLHSGSKKGPKVTNRKQAVAIALNSQRRKDAGK